VADPERPEIDEAWMSRALDLARQGVGLASPNPTVGCVIVREEKIIGAGFHQYERRDHAEIVALRQAGELARGATAYVTLEPCSHRGRTGPCADALIAAGVARVVVATADANPKVHGNGIARLRGADIDVAVGVLETPARRLNDAFAKHIRTGLPYVTLKAAMSLDGRIAPPAVERRPGEISWITGPESRAHVQQLRHSADALITGIGTVLTDDPLLTDRSGLRRGRPLLRVVLDSQLRLPLDSKLVQSSDLDLLVFTSSPDPRRAQALAAQGISVRQIAPEPGTSQPSLAAILHELGAMQIASVMIEAGSRINTSFLGASFVDRLFLFYAPRFLGTQAEPVVERAIVPLTPASDFALHRFGSDFACEVWLNDYWRNPETKADSVGRLAATDKEPLELASLADEWGAGTFERVADSLAYHFKRHGTEVGAASLLQYLRKADHFATSLERSNRSLLPDGSIRYTKSGRYVILGADGKILSFGLVA
jgi:diaminohydroxyphosphoribosylaminopyrimidine deaminase/5-amino-6-(5-phosphoribosylamino)uracil reductase